MNSTSSYGDQSESPILVKGPYKGAFGLTIFCFILPHIETQNLLEASRDRTGNYNVYGSNGVSPWPPTGSGQLFSTVIATYRCPDEPSPSASTGKLDTPYQSIDYQWTASNYAANYLVFGNFKQRSTEGNTRPVDIHNGLSNTIFFTEHYATCGQGNNPNTTFGNIWSDSNPDYRPEFCMNNQWQPPDPATYPGCNGFQVMPEWNMDCNIEMAQTPHSGGIHVALGDGSVRFVMSSISDATWKKLCDPNDGNTLGSDW